MIYTFKSIFATEMQDFLDIIYSAGEGIAAYQTFFAKLDRYLCFVNWQEKTLPEALITEWLNGINCSSVTKQKHVCSTRRFVRYLNALSIQAFEPEMRRASSTYAVYTFSDEEFAIIINTADNYKSNSHSRPHNKNKEYTFPLVLRILYGCGLRIGEVFSLRWDDIDIESRVITIRKAKNNKQRFVPTSSSLMEILHIFKKNKFKSGNDSTLIFEYAFPSSKCSIARFRLWFEEILQDSNMNFSRTKPYERSNCCPHTLRHYFAYKSFMKSESDGRTLEEFAPYLSTYLGHANFVGTEKYITTDYIMYERSHKRMNESIGGLFPEVTFE